MDFSKVLNKRERINENEFFDKTNELFRNPEKQAWNISDIEKN